ncbi:type II toxin-antitoxin system PemK/MazF family toxin [Microcoleus sp. herbarium2]|uniref:type II toxin-antitoxin system PemK/MazF family toxin n=1 Tax=Microcoleus sp. herbarium2 TaxID=3055433 RepID=UPI002FD696A7
MGWASIPLHKFNLDARNNKNYQNSCNISCRVRPHSLLLLYQILTVDKKFLVERVGVLPESLQEQVDEGLRAVLYL